jgi:hypothetical protein
MEPTPQQAPGVVGARVMKGRREVDQDAVDVKEETTFAAGLYWRLSHD